MSETDIPAPVGGASASKKPRSKGWTTLEEGALIDQVLGKEKILFGDLKGAGYSKSIGRRRAETWEAIALAISS